MKRTHILVTLLAILALLSSSCGSGDKIASVSMQVVGASAGVTNLDGMGSTLQLQVMANYTSGKQINETNFATYTITPEGYVCTWSDGACDSSADEAALPTPPYGIALNNTGMIAATETQNGGGICAWQNLNTTSTQLSSPSWFYTGDYVIVATYRGFSSNPIYIPVASGASGQAGQEGICGPSAGAQ